jgi:primosomal protein N' (replication factor Y)
MRYAEVAVNAAVSQTFHYHLPPELEPIVQPGHLVRVGFGTAMQPAVVVALHDSLPPDLLGIQTKPIHELLDTYPVMTPEHVELGLWMSRAYLTAPGACLWLMLPPGFSGRSAKRVHLLQDVTEQPPARQALIDLLRQHSPLSLNDLKKQLDEAQVGRALRELEKAGFVRVESVLSAPTVRPQTVRTAIRTVAEDEVLDALNGLKKRRAYKQAEIFAYIARFDYPVDAPEIHAATGSDNADLNTLEARGLIQQGERLIYRDSLADRDFLPMEAPPLTGSQDAAWQTVCAALDSGASHRFLLHGVTGSGKTEIYLRAIAHTLAQGRQAIFLVPEIALTPQTIRRVAGRFPGQVAVVHGSLSAGERYDTWQRARRGEIGVIVGTRSALFTPLPDCGLVILDEEHDHSYKHAPPFNPPYYHARSAAEMLMQLQQGVLLLGSATPELETFYRAQRGEYDYLHLPDRIMGHRQRIQKQAKQRGRESVYTPEEGEAVSIGLPPVTVVDMREELKSGNRGIFSRALHAALDHVLERGEQALLFLNRRGQASYVFCRDCGYVVQCEHCDTPMTYHREGEAMRCHHCGSSHAAPQHCPNCRSDRIRFFGAGTQQVEAELHKAFHGVTSVRWDADTAFKPELHEQILAQFVEGKAQVMVGTQMIAKGLDLPLVTLVGVVSADPGLALPDFRARERAFQTLTQVAGRAGRSVLGGQVILQTYQPQHPSITAAMHHNYELFYQLELTARRDLGYPPFRRMARLLLLNPHPIEAERQIREVTAQLQQVIDRQRLTDTSLIGPAPCFFSRIDRNYRWHLLIRSADPLVALAGLPHRSGLYVDIDPVDLL